MKYSIRATLLIAATLLMLVGAVGYTFVLLPDLHGDLIEIGVRPTVLGGTVLHLYFAAAAMFAFVAIVATAAFQAMRGGTTAPMPIAVIAIVQSAFGVLAFSRSHNPHHLAPIAMGLLLGVALIARPSRMP